MTVKAPNFSLHRKVALVTGAARGIGRACALACAATMQSDAATRCASEGGESLFFMVPDGADCKRRIIGARLY